MQLPFVNFFKKKEKPQYYLAFILRHEKTIAVIFEQFGAEAKVVGEGEAYFTKNIEDASFEELLTVADKAISKAEEGVPEDAQSLQTLFGLKESWIEEDRIKKIYLERLKKISDELGLVPIGFITITEAITNLLKKEEGAPLTAILAEIGKTYVTVSLIKAGKIMETKSSEIHDNPAFTVDILLKHFEIPEVLPSKIVIYNGGDDDLSQKFISHTWSKSLPFLHVPQIIALPNGFDAKSLLQGAASKMGFEVISESSLKTLERKDDDIPAFDTVEIDKSSEKIDENKEKREDAGSQNEEEHAVNFVEDEDSIEKFGFFENEDVVKMAPVKNIVETAPIDIEDGNNKSSFDEKAIQPDDTFQTVRLENEEKTHAVEQENIEIARKRRGSGNIFKKLGKLSNLFLGVLRKTKLPKNKTIFIPLVIVFVLVVLFIYFFFTLKTTVVLTLNPKLEEQKQNVVFSSENTDVNKKIIKGNFVEANVDGSAQISTTGKKETGDKAKGTITFYSRFADGKTIAAGTILTSSNSLDFTLDKAVEIGSASADASASPTTADGNVTASDIGKESNLPSGTKFNVDNLDPGTIIAKNENAFSGGTKKEITVVAKADTDKLLAQVVKDLEGKAIDSLTQKIDSKENVLLPVPIDSTVEKKSFDKEVGSEATKLNLKATITYQGLSYTKNDLISFTKSLIKKELSAKLEIDESNIKVEVQNVKKKDTNDVSAVLKIKAPLLPNLNKTDIAKSIAGEAKNDAKNKLLKMSQVVNVDINPSLPIPFLTNFLPKFAGNINVVTKINE
jgi:hypothetical protein